MFTATSDALEPRNYQWTFNDHPISWATNSTLVLPNVGLAEVGNYQVIVSNNGGSVTSAVALLEVGFAPVVTSDPTSQEAFLGTQASLGVRVSGTGPLAFQWLKNSAVLAGATSSNLVFGSVQPADQGSYGVVVSSPFGSVTSAVAQVTAMSFASALDVSGLMWSTGGNGPWFPETTNTHDGVAAARSGLIGDSQESWIETTVTGRATFSFWWKASSEYGYDFLRFYLDGAEYTNTSGKTDWHPVQCHLDAGAHLLRWAYLKDESDRVGSDAGFLDQVAVVYAPTVVSTPADQTVVAGAAVRMTVTASGTPPFQYQWFFGGTPLGAATNAILDLSGVDLPQTGDYAVRVSNSAGEVTSASGHLTVLHDPVITTQPVARTLETGGTAVFSVGATGPFYQWKRNGEAIAGATNTTLVLANVSPGQSGVYSVQVFGTLASIESDGVLLTLTGLVMLPTVFIDGPEGVRYRIDYKDSLEDPAWMPLTNVVLPARRLYHVDFTATNSPRRFYLTTPTP